MESLKRLDCKLIAVDIKPDVSWTRIQRVECEELEMVLFQSHVISHHVTALEGQSF